MLFLGVRYVKQKASLLNIDENWNAEAVTNPNISVAKEEMMKGYWTVALFGVDSRNNSVGKGNMADVIIICNINQETGEIKLVSVFRDTYLSVDDREATTRSTRPTSAAAPVRRWRPEPQPGFGD